MELRKLVAFGLILFTLASCKKESSIEVQNLLPKAVLMNVEWGGLPIDEEIAPGQTSRRIKLSANDSYYDVDLPESRPLKFYMNLNGDKVYLETRTSYRLGKDQDIVIIISDTTKVYNPLEE